MIIDMDKLSSRNVVKHNNLIESSYSLKSVHQKIILILVSTINQDDKSFHEVSIPVSEMLKLLGLSKNDYQFLKRITKELNSQVVEYIEHIEGHEVLTQAPWMSYARYSKGFVTLKLNDHIKPYVLNLTANFTSYKLKFTLQFKSKYSIRLYELLSQYLKIGKRTVSIGKLKEMVGVPEKTLKRWVDFKRYVLDHAKNELDEKSDISFTYNAVKDGRSFSDVEFIIYKNKPKENNVTDDQINHIISTISNQKNIIKHEDEISDLINCLWHDFSLSEPEILSLIKDHTKEKLWEKYHYYHYKKSTTEIKNPTAWFINAVIKDYSTADMKQATTIDIDWSGFDLEQAKLTDLKNELSLLSDILKEAQANLASPVCEYSSALREQYKTQIKDTNAKIAEIQNEIKELEDAN
ncbi:RepB family plasmid replication initiator protein [Cysteiniphilum marinum]|uniref:RepB family plasmid replication initiator protein n=1 Tax=Cysteiniphilum marinum TaxID=2774191 RepID=UPI00193BA00E|nr:RepB family plasmid replication initiator protein [Cysteiniphilum marinum]